MFATNPGPHSVVVADFNHDGKLDLAVASRGSQFPEVQIFLGKGDGTFAPPTAYDIGIGEGPLAIADLNHDGNSDLVVVDVDNSVSVLLGNGDGTFQNPVGYAIGGTGSGIAVGDFNGDGDLDIATTNQYPCYCVSVLLGNGDGTFQQTSVVTFVPTILMNGLALGYFNHDRGPDLAIIGNSNNQGRVQILLGNGDGTFRIGDGYQVTAESFTIIATDLRKNGKTDLAVAEFEGPGVAVLLGNGDDGTFLQPVVYSMTGAFAVAAADMNGDGLPDLVAASDSLWPANVGILYGNGDGTFQNALLYPGGNFPEAVAIADFNGDHRLDVAVTDYLGYQEQVLLNTGVVAFSPSAPLNFKKQQHGTTSLPQTVTLTNTGTTTLKISSMKIIGQFGMTSTCGSSVPSGANCSISVTFSPQTQGMKQGTVTILDSASSKPQVIILGGTGT